MAKGSPELTAAYVSLVEEAIFNIMIAMTKAESVEGDFAKLQTEVRNKTSDQLRLVARYAGEYFVEHANPALGKMTKGEVARLKSKAIASALKKLSDEENN